MLQSDDVEIYTARCGNPVLQNMDVFPTLRTRVLFPSMWEERLNRGETMGENTTHVFAAELQGWVEDGENDNVKKKKCKHDGGVAAREVTTAP